MKKSLLLAGMLALGLSALAQNPYAYNASTSDFAANGEEVTVNYTLNAAAERVAVDIVDLNGTVAKTVEFGSTDNTAGDHSVVVDLSGLTPGSDYTLTLRVKGAAIQAPVELTKYTFWSPYGIAVDNNPMSAHFGRILVTECQNSVNSKDANSAYWTSAQHSGVGAGIYVFDPAMNRVQNEQGTYGYVTPGIQETYKYSEYVSEGYASNVFALKKVRISNDGRIFVGGLDVKNGQPVWEVDPDNLGNWTPIFVGDKSKFASTNYDCNLYDQSGEFVAGYSAALALYGEGENLELVNLSSTRGQVFSFGNYKMFDYPLGTATSWSSAVSDEDEVVPLSGQYTISAQSVSIDFDPNGNLWWAQYRGTPSQSQPAIKHVSRNSDGEWEEDYTDYSFSNSSGGIACSHDGSMVAFSKGNNNICIYDVTYDQNGAPTLTEKYNFSTSLKRCNDLAWDVAGNLYSCDNSNEYFAAYAIPRTAAAAPAGIKRSTATDDPNEVATPLRPEFTISLPTIVGVADMNANKAVTAVEYVNMNGQVSNVPFEGVNVVVTKYADGSKTVTKVVK